MDVQRGPGAESARRQFSREFVVCKKEGDWVRAKALLAAVRAAGLGPSAKDYATCISTCGRAAQSKVHKRKSMIRWLEYANC
jgi:hypothetical protein